MRTTYIDCFITPTEGFYGTSFPHNSGRTLAVKTHNSVNTIVEQVEKTAGTSFSMCTTPRYVNMTDIAYITRTYIASIS